MTPWQREYARCVFVGARGRIGSGARKRRGENSSLVVADTEQVGVVCYQRGLDFVPFMERDRRKMCEVKVKILFCSLFNNLFVSITSISACGWIKLSVSTST